MPQFASPLKEEKMVKAPDLYDKAVRLSEKFEENFWELALTLRTLRDVNLDKFRECILTTGIGLRKAYYLVEVAEAIEPLNILPARLRKIGWTKLQLIAKPITKQNAKQMLGWAEEHTVRDLKKVLAGEKPENNSHCVMMYFSPEDYDLFADVLKEHGATVEGRSIANKEEALMHLLKQARGKQKAHTK